MMHSLDRTDEAQRCVDSWPSWARKIVGQTVPANLNDAGGNYYMDAKPQVGDATQGGEPVNIYKLQYQGDFQHFGHCKNMLLHQVNTPWVLVLDSDEYLNPMQHDYIYELITNANNYIGGIYVTNLSISKPLNNTDSPLAARIAREQIRLFRSQLRYVNDNGAELPIHEVIDYDLINNNYKIADSSIVLLHDGYDDPQTVINKLERNIKILWQNAYLMSDNRYWNYMIKTSAQLQIAINKYKGDNNYGN